MRYSRLGRGLSAILASLFLALQLTPLQAALIDNQALLTGASGAERVQLQAALGREDVRRQLTALGVDPADAEARVARLTDAEAAAMAARLEQMPAGGDALGVALVIFIVFIITDVIGATDIFPFVKPVKQ